MPQDDSKRERIYALVRDAVTETISGNVAPPSNESAKSTAFDIPTASDKPVVQQAAMRDESAKTILTEADVRDLEHGASLRVAANVKLTPLASDIINERKINLVTRESRRAALPARIIAIGSDHGGFDYKGQLIKHLEVLNQRPRDFGTHSKDAVDYPEIAHAVASSVAAGESELGIIIDGAGIGSAMAANKVRGIRAAACYSVALAKNSREHNGANVLTLGSSINSFDEVKEIVAAWLASNLTEERHRRRVAKIEAIGATNI